MSRVNCSYPTSPCCSPGDTVFVLVDRDTLRNLRLESTGYVRFSFRVYPVLLVGIFRFIDKGSPSQIRQDRKDEGTRVRFSVIIVTVCTVVLVGCSLGLVTLTGSDRHGYLTLTRHKVGPVSIIIIIENGLNRYPKKDYKDSKGSNPCDETNKRISYSVIKGVHLTDLLVPTGIKPQLYVGIVKYLNVRDTDLFRTLY